MDHRQPGDSDECRQDGERDAHLEVFQEAKLDSRAGRPILPEHLEADEPLDPYVPTVDDAAAPVPLRALLAEIERQAIRRALRACGDNRTKTAERLGISRRQLFDKIREYDLSK